MATRTGQTRAPALLLVLVLPLACRPAERAAPPAPCAVEPPAAGTLAIPDLDWSAPDLSPRNLAAWIATLADDATRGRSAGSPEAREVADLLARYFARLERFRGAGPGGYCQAYELVHRDDQNVTAIARQPEEPQRFVLLGAHYDGQGTSPAGTLVFPSADDNASGVSALLEIARLLAIEPGRPWSQDLGIVITLFGGEEHGHGGAIAWLEQPPVPLDRIELMINLDMVGRRPEAEGTTPARVMVVDADPELRRSVAHAAAQLGIEIRDWSYEESRSDHDLFAPLLPALMLSSGLHADYHAPTDTPDRIDVEQIELAVALTSQLLEERFPPE